MDVGVLVVAIPGRFATTARMIEEMGFASMIIPDSQNLSPDVWGQLMIGAGATTRIRLGPGVTNSVTRDPAVTASAAVSLQAESGGRAVLAIGRGDSAVQRIGKPLDPLAHFEWYIATVQAYLAGETVDRDGFASRLEWLPHVKAPKVPVEVAATGPKVIAAAARHADRICLAVGADPDHVAAMLDHARASARAAGRDPSTLRYGAFVNCVVNDDVRTARDAARGSVASFARFSAMPGSRLGALPPRLHAAAEYLRAHYDMREHTSSTAAHVAGIDDELIDWFAITGPAARAVPRFRRLAELGLDFVHVIPGSSNVPRDVAAASLSKLASEVLPALS